ncbi:hypothetical protein ACM66B_002101 [Microbotryomycetes sp. NB124-2]
MSYQTQQPTLQQYQQPVGHEFDDQARVQHNGYAAQGNSGLGAHQAQTHHQPMQGGFNDHPQARDFHISQQDALKGQQQREHQPHRYHPDMNQLKTNINTAAHTGQPKNIVGGLGGGYGAGVAGKHDGTFGRHDPDWHAEQARKHGHSDQPGGATSSIAASGSQFESPGHSYSQQQAPTHPQGPASVGGAIHEPKADTNGVSKPSIVDKLSGTVDIAVGKMTKNTEKVELGQAKKEGLLH